jgi:hypothetical protein
MDAPVFSAAEAAPTGSLTIAIAKGMPGHIQVDSQLPP